MTEKWTLEPWKFEGGIVKDGTEGDVFRHVLGEFYFHGDGERAVACVNCLRGIPTEELETLWIKTEAVAKAARRAALENGIRDLDADELLRLCELRKGNA